MSHQEILKTLKAKEYKSVYFLHGEESYFIDTVSDYIEKNVLTDAEKGFNQTVMYGKDTEYGIVVDTAMRYPMMAHKQVVILKEAQEMKTLPKLISYVEKPTPTTVLVICYKHKKLNMNTKFGRKLKSHAVVLDAKRLYDNQMGDWISGYLRTKKLKISPKAADLTAEYLGTSLSKVANELDKLAINLAPGTEVTDKHIEENIGISREYNIFELQRALGTKNVLKANRIVNYFISNPKKNPLVLVVGTVYNFFSKVYMYHFVKNESENTILQKMGLRSAWALKEYRAAASKYSLPRVELVISILKEYDLRSKGIHLSTSIADKERGEMTPAAELLREMVWKILHS